jgi:hypothetical protein
MKKKLLFLVLSLVLFGVGLFLLTPESFNYCSGYCFSNLITFGVAQPLFFGTIPIILLFIILLFIKDQEKTNGIYNMFLLFFSLAVIVIYLSPTTCNPLSGSLCVFTKSGLSILLSVLFFIISIFKLIKNRNK